MQQRKHAEKYNKDSKVLLIAYWSISSVQAMCRVNSQNRKKQQHQHRMGPISFVRVRNEMREMNENKESPSQVDVFIATRTGRKGKELDLETQAVVDKLKHHQEVGDSLLCDPRKQHQIVHKCTRCEWQQWRNLVIVMDLICCWKSLLFLLQIWANRQYSRQLGFLSVIV